MGTLPQLASSTNRLENTPLHAGKSTNQTPVLRTKITLYFYKIPFVTQCLPMVLISILKFSKHRLCYPNSCHDHIAKYTHLSHFLTIIPYTLSGFSIQVSYHIINAMVFMFHVNIFKFLNEYIMFQFSCNFPI